MTNNNNGNQGASRYTIPDNNTISAIEKFNLDLNHGKTPADKFFNIPCHQLTPFSLKENADFSPWPDEKFEELILSIKEFGVLHPIIARHLPNKEGTYEILAGEHRWKASKILQLDTIPTYLIHPCDDDKAKSIFTLTNIVNRELSLEDKIYGWSHYYLCTKGKTEETIKKLKEDGVLESFFHTDVSKRQIYRYYRISTLTPPLRQLVIDNSMNLTQAEELSQMSTEDQILLCEYASHLTSSKAIKTVLLLFECKIPGYHYDQEGLDYIFSSSYGAPKSATLGNVMNNAKEIIKTNIPKEKYQFSEEILEDAFALYHKCNGKRSLMEKALEEYLAHHPEEAL